MAFFPKLQLFVWIACERPRGSFAQPCRKHKLPGLRRKTDSALRFNRHALLASAGLAAKNP
jgi:hypothetical protein